MIHAIKLPFSKLTDPAAWLKDRESRITSSDAPSILGCGYKTPLEVYLAKIGLGERFDPTLNMRVGTLCEPVLMQLYEEETGRKVVEREGYYRSREIEWQATTLDGIDSEDEILEGKVISPFSDDWREFGKPGTDDVPEKFAIQAYHHLATTGAKRCNLILLCGSHFAIYHVDRDRGAQDELTRAEASFRRNHVEALVPPAATGRDVKALQRLYENREGDTVWTDDEAIELTERYEALGTIERQAGKEREEIKAALLSRLGAHARATLSNGYVVSSTWRERKGYPVEPSRFQVLNVKAPRAAKQGVA